MKLETKRRLSMLLLAVAVIFAFGLLNILFAIIELYGYFRA